MEEVQTMRTHELYTISTRCQNSKEFLIFFNQDNMAGHVLLILFQISTKVNAVVLGKV